MPPTTGYSLGMMRVTPAVRGILIITISAFLIQLIGDTFFNLGILETLGLVPARVFERHAYWQFITYAFMHGDLFHILFNMLILWMIGSELEARWGVRFFLKYYFICALSASFFYLAVQAFLRGTSAGFIPLVGSSGAVYGLLVAYGIIFSERVLLFMMIFPMKAKHFVLILAGIEFISTVFYSRSGVANAAHLGGMLVGFCYLFLNAYWRIKARQRKTHSKRKITGSHLRLVVNNELLKEFDDEDEDQGPTFH